jgi:sugar (pentulose or hexulose) kinase
MAATATGAFSSLEEGVSRMVRLRPTIYPQTQNHTVYQQGYASYKQLYDCLAPMFHSKV